MRTLVSEVLTAKASVLAAHARSALLNAINWLERQSVASLKSAHLFNVRQLDEGMYVLGKDGVRLFFTTGEDPHGEYAMLLDLTEDNHRASSSPLFAIKDPKTNSNFNPKYNSSINPKHNSSINPKYNSSINPKYNSSINPKYNSSINPKYNSSINPKYNSSINPKYNSSINPKYNSSINPKYNRAYGGPFVYDLDLNRMGYVVRASDSIELVFGLDSEFTGFAVVANSDVSAVFSPEGEWTGYWVTAKDTRLRYSLEGVWLGQIV
jgi:hypothetical protein